MSVFIKITTPGGAVYRLSDGPSEHSGFSWRPKLTNTVSIERAARATENGIPTTTQTLNVWNAERYIGVVDESLNDALTDSTVEIEVSEIQGVWNGIIKAWEQGSNGLLSIRAGQDTLAVFKRQVPDETVRLVTFTGASRDAVNTTIPTVIGGTTSDPIPVPGILIDRAGFTWAFCVGKCRSFVRVKSDRKTITTGFTTYLGTADQAIWPGMVCVKFDADPRDSNGAWPEISAELVGLEIGSTEAEGRNAARVIRAHLTTADTGACGWGLGEPADSIDTVSFDQAILDCDTLKLHLDGMMSQAALSSYWLSQMCLGGRLRLDKPAGKWRLRVDMATDSVKEYDENNILSYSFWPGESSLRHKRARVNYRADFITKQFLGSATRTIGTIGEEENLLEQHLVRDHTTGNALADYVANIEKYGELRMQIQTPDVAVGTRTLEEDEVVTIRVPEFPNGRLFRVTSLSQGTDESKIELRSYSDAIFDTATPETTTDPSLDPIVRAAPLPAPPMDPSGLNLQTNVRVQPDGTIVGYVDITFTPGANALFTRIEVGEGASPISWVELGVVGNNGTKFHHEPAKVGQNYTYRLTSVNTGGSSSVITGNITVAADTTAPLVPQAPVLSTYFKSIAIKCLQNLTKAPDHASFDVYRNTTNNSGTATKIGSTPCLGNTDSVVYLDDATAFDTTYYYWVKSVDTSGNVSGFSAVAGPVSTQRIISGDLAAGALNNSALFAAGVVDAAALADCAVTAAKTALAAVDRYTGKIALAAIDNPNMFTGRPVDSTVVTTGELLTLSAQIKDAIVTSAKIASLDAGKITTGSLDAGRIAAGSLLGCHIAARTITTSNLLVSAPGAALNADPAFLDSSAWTCACGGSGYFACITTVADGCAGCLVMRGNYARIHTAAWFPVDRAKQYRLRARARGAGAANGAFYGRVYWGEPGSLCFCEAFGCGYLTSEWAEKYGVICACNLPAGITCVSIGILLNFAGTSGYHEVQDVRVEEVLPATLIQDGAITTSKLISTGISGACICAGTITTEHLSASGICADCVKAGTLSGVTVCACTGNIGGWTVCETVLRYDGTDGDLRLNNGTYPSIYTYSKSGGCSYAMHGKLYWCSAFQNAYGFSITSSPSGNIAAGMGMATTGGITLPDSSTVLAGCPFFWVGDSGDYVKYYNGTLSVRGDIIVQNGSITANKLISPSQGSAMNDDPYTRDATAWGNGTATICTISDGVNGSAVLKKGPYATAELYSRPIYLTAGKQYRVSMWARRPSGSGSFYFRLYQYNNSDTLLAYSLGYEGTPVPGTSWTRYEAKVTACSGIVYARVTVIPNYGTTTSTDEMQDIRVEEAVPTSLIASGAIAGLTMTSAALYSSNYCAGSAGFCIGCGGGAEFNNVTVRGTVCATAGCFTGSINSCSGYVAGWSLYDGYLYGIRNISGNLTSRTYHIACGQYQKSWFTTKDGLYAEIYQAGIGFLCNSATGYVMASSLCGTGNRAVYSDANGYLTNTSSDCRLKINTTSISDAISIEKAIFSIHGVYFNWRQDIERSRNLGTQREIGLIAQDVQKVFPEAVGTNFDGYLSLDYSKLVPILIEAQKESYARIKSLEDRLCNIETRLAA